MAALTQNVMRRYKAHKRSLNIAPAAAGGEFFNGSYVCAKGGLALPGADVPGLVPLGVLVEPLFPDNPDNIHHHLDNRNGGPGVIQGHPEVAERVVRYDQIGEYSFAVQGSEPLVGSPAYLVDDNTVSFDATVNLIIAGHFTRPAPGGGWFVDSSRRGL